MSPTRTAATPRPLVRREEQRRLNSALARAELGDPSIVVLAGDAGVGKSCLLRAVAGAADATVLFGTCGAIGGGGSPLSPVVEALRFGPHESDVAAHVAPLLELLTTGRSGAQQRPAGDRTEFFQAILELLEHLSERRPTMFVIEDLHAADQSTLDLVTFLLSNLRRQRLTVMVSYRSDDLVAEHPWRPVLAEMVRHPRVDHVDLPPFDRSQVAEQITVLSGRAPDESTLDEVVRRTRGNPFFVEELVDHDAATMRPLSLSLRELLLVKVESLTPATCRLVRIMSLGSPETTDEVLAEVAGISVAGVRAAQREALDRRVLAIGADGPVFRHALVREALEQDLLTGERRDHHAAYAVALTAATPTGLDQAGELATLARHWFGAGDIDAAVRVWVEATNAAERVFAYAEAHSHLESVLRQWDRVAEPERLTLSSRGELLARAADNAYLRGQPDRACELARDALDWIDESTEPRATGMLYERLAHYTTDTADRDRALEYCERAVDLVPATPANTDRAHVLAGWARQLMIALRMREAYAAATAALELARATGASEAENNALNTLGVLVCAFDDEEQGLAILRSALRLARERHDGPQQRRALWNLFACTFETARWEESLERFAEARTALPRLGQGHLLPELYRYAADVLVRLGRWDDADELLDEGLANFAGRREEMMPAELHLVRGKFDEARELITERMARNVYIDEELRVWARINMADLEAWSGHRDEARQAIDEVLEMVLDGDFTLSVGYAVAIGIRIEADAAEAARKNSSLADEQVALDRALSLLPRIHEQIARPGPAGGWKREVGALTRYAEAEQTRVLGESDPNAWAAAVTAWRDLHMPYEAARCQFGQAAALLSRRTDRDHAAALLVEAGEVATRLGALPLRAQIDALARRARIVVGGDDAETATHGLTGREREVLGLLASGATNRGIADALFISVKTAGVHVSSILRKLEVANRAEATSVAFRDGLVS